MLERARGRAVPLGQGGRPVLRIHFTAQDLARTRVATTIGVAAETYYSLELLRERRDAPRFGHWRAAVAPRMGRRPARWRPCSRSAGRGSTCWP